MTENPPASLPDARMISRRLWTVRGAALGSMLVMFLGSVPELVAGQELFLLATLPFQIPYLFVLGYLWKRPQKKGLALALGIGTILGGIGLLLAALATRDSGRLMLAAFSVFVLVQGILVVNAGRAFRMLGHETGDWRKLARGFLEPLIYFAVIAFPVLVSLPMFLAGEKRKETRPVVEWMEKLHRCAEAYASAHPALGFPMRLELLGTAGSNCVSKEPAAGPKGRYSVLYTPGTPDATGRTTTYILQASPPKKGLPRFSMNESGVVQSLE